MLACSPKAFYWNQDFPCTFETVILLPSLDGFNHAASKLLYLPQCTNPIEKPECPYRCPLGNCLIMQQLCDGRSDCHDNSDETRSVCDFYGRNRCGTNQFSCADFHSCIPMAHVCNQKKDCPGEDDEANCLALRPSLYDQSYSMVRERTFGIWHDKCFRNYSADDFNTLCLRLGFELANTHAEWNILPLEYLHQQTKVVVTDGGLPIAVPWDLNDMKCGPVEIKCLN